MKKKLFNGASIYLWKGEIDIKTKLYSFLVTVFLLVFLTGCSEMEEILTKINQLLDNELASESTEEGENLVEDDVSTMEEDDVTEVSSEEDVTDDVSAESNKESQATSDNNDSAGGTKEKWDLRGILETRPIGNVFLGPELPFEGHFSNYDILALEQPDYLPVVHPDSWILVDEFLDELYEGYLALYLVNSDKSFDQIIEELVTSDSYYDYEKLDHPEYKEYYVLDRHIDFSHEEFFGWYHFYVDDYGNKMVYVMLDNEDVYGILN